MTSVLLNSPASAAIARALLHFIWEGALIALLLGLVLEVFQPRSARFRYAAACATMLAMLGAFGGTIARSWPHASAPAPLQPASLQMAPPRALPSAPAPAPANPGDRLRWLVPLWMAGVALFGARSVASFLAAQRLRHTGICEPSDYWQRKIVELSETIRLSRPVALLESCLTEVPVVVGWLRPVVLFPAGLLSGFPPEQVEYFLLHELAHVRRWDYLVNFIQSLAEDALFYHPAVWWVSAKIRSERENCCDDVVAELGHAPGFAAALAALEQNRNVARLPALAVNGGRLMHRIQRLLGRPEAPRGAVAPALLAGSLAISIAVAIGATQPPSPGVVKPPRAENLRPLLLAQAQSNPRPNAQADTPQQTPYEKWLNEEVVYIITDAERNAFLALRTDEERQHFIEQFWQRRDPTPGTPENEFQEEHYRRIAYANDNFSYPGTPGWKSDRGGVYIKFGPPDELESQPGTGAAPPTQRWYYRYIEPIGANVNLEFVDPSRTGEYHMTTDPLVRFGALNIASVTVASRVSGTISAIHVQNGQTVRPGQILVDIDSGSDSPYNHITSPIDGVISNSTAQVGGRVEPGVRLMVISATPVAAAATVPSSAIREVPTLTSDFAPQFGTAGALPSPNPQVQTLSAEYPPENIVEAIDFRGSRRVPQDTLRALIFTKPGDPYNENALQRDLRSLWNTGRYDEITIERQAGQRGWIVHFVVRERSIARATDPAFEADVKATMYQAGREASYLCLSQGGTFDSCNDQFQATFLGIAVKTMDLIVKTSGYVPTAEAQNALAVLRKTVDDARAERLSAR